MDKILLSHGSGGRHSHELMNKYLLKYLANPILNRMDDAAILKLEGKVAFTTDSFVVKPIFFPGGDIGKLAICGTINDLAMCGARPQYLSLALIIEEGLSIDELEKVMASIQAVAKETGIQVVTGDTKVVNHGNADKLFINTTGIGIVPPEVNISGSNARVGDRIILSGSIGDHGMAVLTQREGLRFKTSIQSDCAPLNSLAASLLTFPEAIHAMRDPTRGGLATTLNELALQSRTGFKIIENAIPVNESVKSACDMLGLDPLYVANEGKLVAIVAPEYADRILSLVQQHPLGRQSIIIGEVTEDHPGRVVMQTQLGASRIIDMLSGELLPRIC